VGQVLDDAPKDTKSAENTRVQTVTLLVKVADVPKLHLAQTRGKITLAMRGSDDLIISHKTFTDDENRDKAAASRAAMHDGAANVFAQMWKKAAEAPPGAPVRATYAEAPPAAPTPRPYTVTVVNGSASSKVESKVDRKTYRDPNSMSEVGDDSNPPSTAPARHAPPSQTNHNPDASDRAAPANPDFPDDPGEDEVKDDEPQRQG
jgi:hypothetical protein